MAYQWPKDIQHQHKLATQAIEMPLLLSVYQIEPDLKQHLASVPQEQAFYSDECRSW